MGNKKSQARRENFALGGAFFFFLVFFFFFPFLRTSPILVPPSHPLPFPACFVGFGGEVCVGCSIVAAVFFPLPPVVGSRGVSDDAATREALYCATALFLLPFATGRVGGDDGGGGVRALLMPEPGQPSGLDLMDPRRPTDRRRAPSPFEFETGENRDDGRMGVSPAHRPYHGHDHATTRLNPNRRTLQICLQGTRAGAAKYASNLGISLDELPAASTTRIVWVRFVGRRGRQQGGNRRSKN